MAEVYCHFVSDRIPLWVCKKYGNGVWKPEYRLHSIWVPAVIMPVALGLFGASLKYHIHYMVLAFASFLINFAAVGAAPIIMNYLVETFKHLPNEIAATMNLYRTIIGLIVPFFVDPWISTVGIGWVFGMMAIFTIFSEGLVVILLIWGHNIRQMSIIQKHDSEEGVHVLESKKRELECS